MPVIPRYDQRTRPALRGLQAPSPIVSAGDDLRTIGKVAGLAGGLWDSAASMQAVREADARWREAQARQARDPAVTETALRDAFAEDLPPAEREAFAQVSGSRAAAFDAETQGRISQAVQEQAAELSRRRQVLGLDEYHRLADLDEPQAMASLASAIAEQGERLAAGGVDSATVQTARRELFAQAVVERIAHRAAIDPDGAEVLLQKDGTMIPAADQATLRASIRTERIRQDARGFAARVMTASDAGREDLESALQLADAEAHGDPERMRAYRAAAIGAQRKARARREEREGAAWDGVRPFLAPDAAAPWTELPGPIWSALSDRQKETVSAMLEAPERESDPVVLSHLKDIAAQDPERFRMLDLGALGTGLDAADHSFWRELQGEARRNTGVWKGERAYLAQVGRAVRASIPADLDGPTRAGLEVNLNQVVADTEVMEGRRLSWAELLAVCQQGVAPPQSNPSAQDKELNRRLWSRGYSGDDLQFDPRTGQIYRWATVPIPGQFHGTRIEKVIVSDAEVRMGRNRRLGVEAYADPYPMSKEEELMRTFELSAFSEDPLPTARRASPQAIPPERASTKIDWSFVAGEEAPGGVTILKGYVPQRKSGSVIGKSGVTIGLGVDLGRRSEEGLRQLDLPEDLIQKLKPHLGKRREDALASLKAQPLILSREEADLLDNAIHNKELRQLIRAFDKDSKVGPFTSLPPNTQTMLMSLFLQYGTEAPSDAAPKTWGALTSGEWDAALSHMNNFDDEFDKRRGKEAKLLEEDIKADRLPKGAKARATKAPPPASPIP